MAKFNWQKLLNTTWFYTKVLFSMMALMLITYMWGTYNPNKKAVKQANVELEQFYIQKIKDMELREPEFVYNNDIQFVRAMHKCIDYINFSLPRLDRVPYEMIVAQAALETGWGTSRFAVEGNNLFGIRTWNIDEPHLLPIPWTKWPGWGVKVYETRCDSVRDYLRILNEVFAFTEFRAARDSGVDDGLVLAEYLTQYASNQNYVELIKEVIQYNIRGEYDI